MGKQKNLQFITESEPLVMNYSTNSERLDITINENYLDDTYPLPAVSDKHDQEIKSSFGHKTIGAIGSISLLIGNMTGPGMVGIALQFQQGGWLLTILGFAAIMLLSTLAGLFMIESMASIPGNPRFQLRVEFTMLVRFYFGKWGYYIAQVFINIALQATNVASIIICAQVMDSMFIFMFKKTCGLEAYPHVRWVCETVASSNSSPFNSEYYMFFTLGYLVVLVLIIPLGFLNLDDNIIVQICAVCLMFTITSSWVIMFIIHGLNVDNMPTFGDGPGMAQIMGNVMFNYAYVTTIPSWVNEAKPTVNINKTVWGSASLSTAVFVVIGLFGALSFGHMPSSSDILSVINSSPEANIFSKICVYIFPFVVLASSIPVYSIIVRYNLMQNDLMPKSAANFVAVVLPWLIVIPFMTGDGLNKISNWSSIFFSSIANFIIPLLIYLRSIQFRKGKKKMTNEQKKILQTLIQDTVDFEENKHLLTFKDHHSMYRAFRRMARETCRRLATFAVSTLGVLILLLER
ncbi:hypothetical protein DFA_06726 [Cavenderia fasciculata]|uniref:Amino acid transporter transmembrane domain-containing protein n=1 Tax=Cavenderia fasciculata TaxID=261658 RepID=F4Q239_CACFS|nr:uncharacterized protein DFA_06726 [Cavenderia fasciculata]EGG18059.1 hypothetical protein DFA_06726 [Cavenderia fasciculata]|eukprot:XP_004356952.1 hypothetical protein DFA_06726 [Cavenderia fasciculata]